MKIISSTDPEPLMPVPKKRRCESAAQRLKRKLRLVSPVPPIPRPFDFGFTARRPLVPVTAVCMFLDRNPVQVGELIESGRLRWAFDIRSQKSKQREIRILRQSLFEFTGLYAPEKDSEDEQSEFEAISKLAVPPGTDLQPGSVFPRLKPCKTKGGMPLHLRLRLAAVSLRKTTIPRESVLCATEIAKCFSCNSQHVGNLIREKLLQAVNIRRGPKASPLVTRASVIDFLKQRRIS